MWFGSTTFDCHENRVHLAAPNRFVADWIKRHHRQLIGQAAAEELGGPVDVEVRVDALPDKAPPAPRGPARPDPAATDRGPVASRDRTHLRFRLDDFVVGSSNELAFNCVCRLVDEPRSDLNPLFIHGGCGLGKTHLLQGMCRRFALAHPSSIWLYVTAEQFTNDYIAAVRSNRLDAFRARLRKVDLLVIDDVQFMSGKNATQSEFLHTFNAIDLRGSKLVMASDAHPNHIQQFSKALVSRFVSGMVVEIGQPDAAMRARIIRAIATRRNMRVADSVVGALADRCVGSVRELEGTMTRLSALATLLGDEEKDRPIGHAVLNQLFAEAAPSPPRRPVRVEQILEVVCHELQVESSAVLSTSRQKQVVLARSLVIYLARRMTSHSYPDIARRLGRPNHSTIITADQRMARQVADRKPVCLLPDGQPTTADLLAQHLQQRIRERVNRAA
jgi:chromosomal replication initiator protein